MIKLVYLVARRPGLEEAEFFRYWREERGPLGARIPGVRRLVQSGAPAALGNPRPSDFDAMTELWFDDVAALLAARDSPEWRAASDGERRFVDPRRTACFIADEVEVPPALSISIATIGTAGLTQS
ncbi:MAG TPA: EthD domain-containing protein [Longimicrobium sp.]|nr:EthD domain-containing protein [Longimicrobium sp.]